MYSERLPCYATSKRPRLWIADLHKLHATLYTRLFASSVLLGAAVLEVASCTVNKTLRKAENFVRRGRDTGLRPLRQPPRTDPTSLAYKRAETKHFASLTWIIATTLAREKEQPPHSKAHIWFTIDRSVKAPARASKPATASVLGNHRWRSTHQSTASLISLTLHHE